MARQLSSNIDKALTATVEGLSISLPYSGEGSGPTTKGLRWQSAKGAWIFEYLSQLRHLGTHQRDVCSWCLGPPTHHLCHPTIRRNHGGLRPPHILPSGPFRSRSTGRAVYALLFSSSHRNASGYHRYPHSIFHPHCLTFDCLYVAYKALPISKDPTHEGVYQQMIEEYHTSHPIHMMTFDSLFTTIRTTWASRTG